MKPRMFHTRGYTTATSYRTEATALFAAHSAQLTDPQKSAVNTFIDTLITSGDWAKIDVLWVPMMVTEQQSLLNWKNPGTNTAVANNFASTFVTKIGYPANLAASAYINTNWNPTTHAVNYGVINCSVFAALKDSGQDDGYTLGSLNTSRNIVLIPRDTSNTFTGWLNDARGQGTVTDSSGLFAMSTTNGSTMQLSRNGTSITTTSTLTTAGYPNNNIYLYCRNVGTNTAQDFINTNTIQLAGFGSGTVNFSTLYSAFNTFKTNF